MKNRDEFIAQNMGLVHACLKRFKNKGIEYDDLLQAGTVGLIKACDRFNPELGFKFSTYAVPIILGEIKHIFRENSTVKVSRYLKDLSNKINRVHDSFAMSHGRSPTIGELSELLGEDKEKIIQAMDATRPTVSLSGYGTDEEESTIDIPIDEAYDTIADKIDLKRELEKLKDEDKLLIVLRFFRNKTQAESAKILGTTQVQVSRREKKILNKLRIKLG